MKIIALVGKANTGKTSTLKKLIKELAGKSGENLIDVPKAHKCKTFISPQKKELLTSLDDLEGDIFVKLKSEALSVGISTSGDIRWNIESKFDLLKDCDIFICSSRDCGESYEYIKELMKTYELVRINKIGCIGNKDDANYRVLTKHSEELSIVEILKHLEETK